MRLLALCLVLSGCNITGPDFETIDRRPLILEYPDLYRRWFDEVQGCMESPGVRQFESIVWFVADSLKLDGAGIRVAWTAPDEITLRSDRLLARRDVKHEVIHHLRNDPGSGHPPVFDRCAPSPYA